MIIKWEDPPKETVPVQYVLWVELIVKELKERPRQWALVLEHKFGDGTDSLNDYQAKADALYKRVGYKGIKSVKDEDYTRTYARYLPIGRFL